MTSLVFKRKPAPLYAEYRPLYVIARILLVLYLASRATKSSIARLHLFHWALRDKGRWESLRRAAGGNVLSVNTWGMDPALNQALTYAVGEDLLEQQGQSYRLTSSGRDLAKRIVDEEILAQEAAFLKALGSRVTERLVTQIMDRWG